jgi:iron complex outermembrane receptor protein
MTRSFLLGGVAVLCFASPCFAQTDPTWRPDEIIVTGERRAPYAAEEASVARAPVPLEQIPQSIQVLTPALLKEQELRTLSDALSNISGVVANRPAETVLVNPIVRGFEAEIFVDGLIGYGDTAVIDPSSLAGVERIEVAKGPTSALFGGGTGAPVGGLINVVTKTPAPEAFARVGLRAGSFSTVAPSVDLNLPLGDGAGFRLAGEYFSSDDYIDEVETERVTLNPSFRASVGGKTDLILRGGYNRIEQLEYVGLPAAVIGLPGVDPRQFGAAPDAPDTVVENFSVHGALTHEFSDRASATLQVRRFDSSFDEFSSFPFLAFFPLAGTEAAIIRGQLPVDTGEWTFDGAVTAKFATGGVEHVLLAGATHDRTDYNAATGFDFTPIGILDYADPGPLSFGPVPALDTFIANDYRTTAFYAQDHATIGRLHLLLSGRISRYRLIEELGGAGADLAFERFDPRIGLTFDVADGVSVFAGYATGSRLTLFFNGGSTPPKLETSTTVEGGVKFALEDIGLSGTIAGYRIVRENVPTPDPTTFITSVQTGEQRGAGAEVDLVYEPSPNLSVLLSAAYTDAKVTADTQIPIGARLPRVPETSGRLAVRYRFDGALDGLGIGAGLTYSQEAATAFPNPFSPDFPRVFDSDAFVVADLQASYDTGRYRIGVSVENLFDETYVVPYQYLGQEVVRPGQPRSAFATLSAEF